MSSLFFILASHPLILLSNLPKAVYPPLLMLKSIGLINSIAERVIIKCNSCLLAQQTRGKINPERNLMTPIIRALSIMKTHQEMMEAPNLEKQSIRTLCWTFSDTLSPAVRNRSTASWCNIFFRSFPLT